MKITWFGHSAFRLDFADKVVLIDPFFTGNPAFEGSAEAAREGVTHVLVTHGHGDHFFGLAPLLERFPHARAIALPKTWRARCGRSCAWAQRPIRKEIIATPIGW